MKSACHGLFAYGQRESLIWFSPIHQSHPSH